MEDETFFDSLDENLENFASKDLENNEEQTSITPAEDDDQHEAVSPRSVQREEQKSKTSEDGDENRADLTQSCIEIDKRLELIRKSKRRNITKPNSYNASYLEIYRAKTPEHSDRLRLPFQKKTDSLNCEDLPTDQIYFNIESKLDSESLCETISLEEKSIRVHKIMYGGPNHGSTSCFNTKPQTRPRSGFHSCNNPQSKNVIGTKSSVKLLQIPELGGLGPNVLKEKVELFRKRMSYGKSASDKNRSKMEEKILLKNLQQEIDASKNI